jgi:hypothetical protein
MHHNRDQLVGMGDRNAPQTAYDAGLQRGETLRAGQRAPTFNLTSANYRRIILRGAKPKLAPVPIAQKHLTQIRLDTRGDPQGCRQRRGGLVRALHGRHVNRVNRLTSEPLAYGTGLSLALGAQGGIPLPINHRKAFAAHGGLRLTVADQQNITGPFCGGKPMLPYLVAHISPFQITLPQ